MQKINWIREKIKANTVLFSNFSYLSFLQVASLLIPLVTYPYLIRVLGKELYGLVVFTQVIAGYFTIFISFGFSISGAKEVSIYRDDKQKLSEIVSAISFVKLVFLALSFVVLLGYLMYVDVPHKLLYVLAFWVCITDLVFPIWFFQGIEKMKFITLISLVTRLVFIALIFVLVKGKDDVLWFPFANLIGALVSGVVSFYLIWKEGVRLILPSFSMIKESLKKSYHFFLSNVLVQIYANSNKAVIGVFLGMGAVAYYDLAEKIANLIRMPQGILSQTVFPRISATKSVDFVKKIFKVSVGLNVGLYVVLFFTAEYVVLWLGGKEMLVAVPVVRILGFLAPVVGVSNVMGMLTLIPFGFNKLFTQMIGISVVSYLLMFLIIWQTNNISIYSLSTINVLVEMVVSVISVYFVYKSNIL